MAVALVLGDRAALHGTSLPHRPGAIIPLPVPVPCSPCSPATGASCSAGHCPRAAGASTDPPEREQSTGSSRVAASLELLLPALTHTFIRINEACNKRIREAKKAAETEAQAGSRQEGHEGVCGSVKLARAAQEQHTSLGTCPQLPTWTHSSAHGAHRHEEKRHSLTRDQPSIFEKSH